MPKTTENVNRTQPSATIYVFRINEAGLPGVRDLLDEQERLQANRYRRELPRQQFMQSRAVLRSVLSKQLGLNPWSIPLRLGDGGKPYLADSGLQFNLSHSEDVGVLAIAEGVPVGVDVERIGPLPEVIRLSEHYLAPDESDVGNQEPGERDKAFLRCWTRKEAYLKGLGVGLTKPLNSFRIGREEQDVRGFVPVIDPSLANTEWFVRSFTPCEGYVGALALTGKDVDVHQLPCVPADNLLSPARTMCA